MTVLAQTTASPALDEICERHTCDEVVEYGEREQQRSEALKSPETTAQRSESSM
jgi:hypothetical protein